MGNSVQSHKAPNIEPDLESRKIGPGKYELQNNSYQCYTRYVNGQRIQISSLCKRKDIDDITDFESKDDTTICNVIKKYWDERTGELIRQEEYKNLKPSQVGRFMRHRNLFPTPIEDESAKDSEIAPAVVKTKEDITTKSKDISAYSEEEIEQIFKQIESEASRGLKEVLAMAKSALTTFGRLSENYKDDFYGILEGFKGEFPETPKRSWQRELDESFEEDNESRSDEDRL